MTRRPMRNVRTLLIELLFLALLMPLLAAVAFGQADSDGDGILDDGDASGSPVDCPCNSPCAPATTLDCDDNCRFVPNPTQASNGSGVGDACNLAPRSEAFEVNNNQQFDAPRYRWKGEPDYLEPSVAALTTVVPEGGGTCEFLSITVEEGPEIGFIWPPIPPEGPFGGLACCEWQSRCSIGCANVEGAAVNDCPVGTNCLISNVEIDPCTDALFGRCTGDNAICANDGECTSGTCDLGVFVDPFEIENDHDRLVAVGLALQDPDPGGACAGVPGVPWASCCFDFSRNVDYYWGTARLPAGNPLLGQSQDGDDQPDVCDNCPFDANTDQADFDADGCGDVCDNMPTVFNPTTCPEPGFGLALATASLLMAAIGRRRAGAGRE